MTDRRVDHKFDAIEPMLWRVLSILAKHGFVSAPSDAQDLIHDFYLDAWPGVKERFDETFGSFETYLSASFYRFARRKIVSLNTWRQSLVDVDALADLPSHEASPAEVLEEKQHLLAIQATLNRLPANERSILHDYLSEPEGGERAIAAKHNITRYAMREILLNAIGRVAVELGNVDPKKDESLAAFYLWHEGRSPKNVSSLMGVPISEVHRLKSKFTSSLLASMKSSHLTNSPKGTIMGTIESLSPLHLFKEALLAVDNVSLLDAVRLKASAIRQALDSDADLEFSRPQAQQLEAHPEWLARVYDAVAAYDPEHSEDKVVEDAIAALLAQDARETGEAFVALLQVLPGEFSLWQPLFALAPTHDLMKAHLLLDPSFDASKEAEVLASLGLTPQMFLAAVRGMQLLFDRTLRQGEAKPVTAQSCNLPSIRLCDNQGQVQINPELLLAQMRTTPSLRPDAALPLARWLLSALEYRPYLIAGYVAYVDDASVVFHKLKGDAIAQSEVTNLMTRWSARDFGRMGLEVAPPWSVTQLIGKSAEIQGA